MQMSGKLYAPADFMEFYLFTYKVCKLCCLCVLYKHQAKRLIKGGREGTRGITPDSGEIGDG
jgi:hypothetical protein